jgi:hypothetical protein
VLVYRRNLGKVKTKFNFKSSLEVAGDGIEPSTSRFSVARSYQLSYPAE